LIPLLRVVVCRPLGGAKADPFVFDLVEMDGRIILRDIQVKIGGGKTANGSHDRIGGNDPVALRNNKTDPGIQQDLLRKKDIESGALTDFRSLPDTIERDFGRFDRRFGRWPRLNSASIPITRIRRRTRFRLTPQP